jgi:triosephosphate isomerase
MAEIVIAGNWKMHMGPAETADFFRRFKPDVDEPFPEILIFPPTLSLRVALASLPSRPEIALGVQNIHWEESGAFTGEISAEMALEAGATHCLVGHSERRHVFGESDEQVKLKVRAAHRAGLTPVICVGETLDQRESGRLEEVLLRQVDAALEAVRENREAPFLFAYEPVWAIGTGKTATPEDASDAHFTLRQRLRQLLGGEAAAEIRILYGGSVKPENARTLLDASDVDGVLVGGASLDPESFALIAAAGH